MSQQPRQGPSHSSSPSKSSVRRTPSGGCTTTTNASQPQQQPTNTRSLLPSPHFEDDPIVASHQQHSKRPSLTLLNPEYSEHAVAESEHYSNGAHAQVIGGDSSIPSFQPFFTLIEDTVTNEHHHPTVHYIFADDDADIITEAALRSLEVLDPSQSVGGGSTTKGGGQREAKSQATQAAHNNGGEDSLNASRLPPPIAEVREHYIILDVHPQVQPQPQTTTQTEDHPANPTYSYEVTSAHSLSAEWQVLRTRISTAPTIGDNPGTDDEGLMLRIEGRGNTPGDTSHPVGADKGKGKAEEGAEKEKERESMEEMIERFQRRLEEVRMVLEAGGGGIAGLGGGDGAGLEE